MTLSFEFSSPSCDQPVYDLERAVFKRN